MSHCFSDQPGEPELNEHHTWPSLYILPEFPGHLVTMLERDREKVKLDAITTNLIVRIMKEDMEKYYPKDRA